MYKLKEETEWEDVKWIYKHANFRFDDYFEEVDLPVIGLKEQSFEILGKKAEINYTENYNKSYSGWSIGIYDDFGLSVEIYVGETDVIKSVEDFNEKCALLFGFYLKEV